MAELAGKFESVSQEWETPDDLYERLDVLYGFTRDVCAAEDNKKCDDFWSTSNSCLDKEWDGVNWMNPPYKDLKKFVQKAHDEAFRAVTVCLIPARTNTKWWHELCMQGEVSFICGRPKFKGCVHGLPQPLALVVFGQGSGVMESFYL
jgi:phage N-6-adenine-methyltransferase